jgi:hypothetical protein
LRRVIDDPHRLLVATLAVFAAEDFAQVGGVGLRERSGSSVQALCGSAEIVSDGSSALKAEKPEKL